jgi:hypothetical protein
MTNKTNKINPKNIFAWAHVLLTWLNISLIKDNRALQSILKVVSKLNNILINRGIAQLLLYVKTLRLEFIKILFKLESLEDVKNISNVPKPLKPLIRIIKDSPNYPVFRLILSALYLTRAIRLKPTASFKTISDLPTYCDAFFDGLEKDVRLFLKDLGLDSRRFGQRPSTLDWKEFHMSSKSGPNGHALWSSFVDNAVLPEDLRQAIGVVGGEKLKDLMDRNLILSRDKIPHFFNRFKSSRREVVLRKLVIIPDKEGKTREIAIGDYWTQCALKPLNNKIFRIFQSIEQDCTHQQTKHLGKIVPREGSSYHSIDLTAFSDRFPIKLEHLILSVWLGKEYADSWKHMMVGYPLESPIGPIVYGTGNPMGFYSSWATASLAHHFIIWKACKQANRNWRRCPYMLLGDDIVICDDEVAYQYREVLLPKLGVDYSVPKTHISLYGYEFAKQFILHNQNISPFPLAALYERRNSPIESVGIILRELWTKDWTSDIAPILKNYFVLVQKWPRPKYQAFEPKIKLVVSLLSYLQGRGDLGTAILEYVTNWTGISKWQSPNLHFSMFGKWTAMKVVHKLFLESRDRVTNYGGSKLPLGELATQMVMQITSLRDGGADCFDLIESVPFLQVYGRAEEVFLKLQGDLNDRGLGEDGEALREYIGKVDIPLSDRDFYVRHRDVLVIKALKASRLIEEIIKTTPQVVSWNGRLDFTLPWWEFTHYSGELLEDRRMPPRVKPDPGLKH